ncbi:YjgF-like protein [Pisolithus croceorrhizus]|nr:YjgF-like protein [Pisolithus croceorrhizus]
MSDDGSVDTSATCGTTTTKEIVYSFRLPSHLSVSSRAMSTSQGCIGCDSEYLVVEGGIQAQTVSRSPRETFPRSSRHQDFLPMNEIYEQVRPNTLPFSGSVRPTNEQFFTREKLPARTCVGVSALPMGAFIEIDCIAEIPDTKLP